MLFIWHRQPKWLHSPYVFPVLHYWLVLVKENVLFQCRRNLIRPHWRCWLFLFRNIQICIKRKTHRIKEMSNFRHLSLSVITALINTTDGWSYFNCWFEITSTLIEHDENGGVNYSGWKKDLEQSFIQNLEMKLLRFSPSKSASCMNIILWKDSNYSIFSPNTVNFFLGTF